MKRVITIIFVFISLLNANEDVKRSFMINYNPTITLKSAKMYIEEAEKIALSKKLNLSIAIVDSAGYLVSFSKMDEASLVTIDVAIQKAKTAALLKAPSKLFEDKINLGEPSMLSVPNLTPLQGGVPIMYEGKVCGAIGVSGASGDIDNEIAIKVAEVFLEN